MRETKLKYKNKFLRNKEMEMWFLERRIMDLTEFQISMVEWFTEDHIYTGIYVSVYNMETIILYCPMLEINNM